MVRIPLVLVAAVLQLAHVTRVHAQVLDLDLPKPVQYTLDNGLSVVLQPDRRRPRVAVAVAYRAGYRDDPPGYSGLAHLTEHMTFRGSRHLDDDEPLTAIEGIGGTANATTNRDDTIYFAELPAAHLPRALWIESERMAFTLEAMASDDLDVERDVVESEWRQRRKNNVGARLPEFVRHEKSPAGHVYRHVDDLDTDVGSLEIDHVRWFFQQHYRPGNATLVVIGDFEIQVARRLIQQYFGSIGAPARKTQRTDAPAVAFGGRARLTLAAPLTDPRVEMHWSVPCRSLRCFSEMLLASYVLAHRRRGILEHALLSAGLPARVWVNVVLYPGFMDVVLVSRFNDTKQVHVGLPILEEYLERVRTKPIAADALKMGHYAFATHFLEAHDSTLSTALWLAAEPNLHLESLLAGVMNVTAEDLRAAIALWLPADRRLVVVVERDEHADSEGEVVSREGDLQPHVYRRERNRAPAETRQQEAR